MTYHAVCAAALHKPEIFKICALAVALFGDGNELFAVVDGNDSGNIVALAQSYADNSARGASHSTRSTFGKADGRAVCGGNDYIAHAVSQHYRDQLVAIIESDGNLSAAALIFIFGKQRALYNALTCHHCQVFFVSALKAVNADNSRYLLARRKLKDIYYI